MARQRRSFGWLRRLPSGRWQASYTGPDTMRHYAPSTFTAKLDAEACLPTPGERSSAASGSRPAPRGHRSRWRSGPNAGSLAAS